MTVGNVLLTANARARVTVTLEIPLADSWGGTTAINQVVGQATDVAINMLHELTRNGARIIGDPVVTMVLVDGKDRR